jgi:hypothetical protein
VTWFPAFSLFSWDYLRGRRAPEAYLSHMGLWNLVPDGSGELARVPTGLEQRYAELAAATTENARDSAPAPRPTAGSASRQPSPSVPSTSGR